MNQLVRRGVALGALVIGALVFSAAPASAKDYKFDEGRNTYGYEKQNTYGYENRDCAPVYSPAPCQTVSGDCKVVLTRCDSKPVCNPVCNPICNPICQPICKPICYPPCQPPCNGGQTPEPTSLLLLGLGGLGVVTRLRRRVGV